MEMNSSLQTNLCKGLRACGIPKSQANEILDIVRKWYRENGPEWTNSRIKDLRQWYETTLTGNPQPPRWFKHSKEGYPLGIWKWVFNLTPAKALGVLSCNTVFYEHKLTESQKEKFLHGLAGNNLQQPDTVQKLLDQTKGLCPMSKVAFHEMPAIHFPTLFDMTGSIPVHESRSTVRSDNTLSTALKALRASWESVPQVTFDFLDKQDLLSYMPPSVLGNDYQLELNKPHERCVGRVSVLQQAQLKARIVGNPNRVLQVTLEPLKEVYMTTARKLPTDVTHDQESGVNWVQEQLRQGNELAGSDLTSASDLLDVRLSLKLVDHVFRFPEIQGYKEYEEYFLEVSRSTWWCPALNCEVQWKQGDVLGTGPSFGLLTLTNNACAYYAYWACVAEGTIDKSIPWHDCFRIVGDDIVMRSQLEKHYTRMIELLGGEINHSKTLKSDRVAEFAGRVITSYGRYLKAIKYSEPSDNSFLNYVSQLGDQAKYLLLPKQRKVYNLLREVPGVVVPGPWNQDSYGIPLGLRYSWYLQEVQPVLETADTDLELTDYSMELLKAQLSLSEAGANEDKLIYDEPFFDEGYLPSQVSPTFKPKGDPRLTNGKSVLEVLYPHVERKDILGFSDWMSQQNLTSSNEQLGDDASISSHEASLDREPMDEEMVELSTTAPSRISDEEISDSYETNESQYEDYDDFEEEL